MVKVTSVGILESLSRQLQHLVQEDALTYAVAILETFSFIPDRYMN